MLPSRLTPRRAVQLFTLGSGPLKRTSDRVEFLARVVLTIVLVAAAPVALALATASSVQGRSEVLAQAADRHRVSARLLEDVSPIHDGSEGISQLGQVSAVWTGPTGVEHTGEITAPLPAQAGSLRSIWIDRQGNRTTRPISNGDVAARSTGIAIVVYLGTAYVVWGGYRCLRGLLDLSRSRRWAAEWAVVGPQWTGKVP
jgi:hypothetical protein